MGVRSLIWHPLSTMKLSSGTTRGYVDAGLGAVAGAFIVAVIGGLLGSLYAPLFMPDEGMEQLGPPIVGFGVGIWLGGALGCLLALRIRHHSAAVSTAVILALTVPLLVLMGYRLEHYGGTSSAVESVAVVMGFAVPLLARHLALAAQGSLEGRPGVDTRLMRIALVLAVVTTAILLFLPIVVTERGEIIHDPRSGPATKTTFKHTTMAREQGLLLVGGMMLLAAGPLALNRTHVRKAAQVLAATFLLIGALATIGQAGIFYVPAALVMLMACWSRT